MKPSYALTISTLNWLLLGCATPPLPVAVSCPRLPDPPPAVANYATPPDNLIENSAKLLESYTARLQDSLKKASGLGI